MSSLKDLSPATIRQIIAHRHIFEYRYILQKYVTLEPALPLRYIEKLARDDDEVMLGIALEACKLLSDSPISLIERGLSHARIAVRYAALDACRSNTVAPLSLIKEWAHDERPFYRQAAMLLGIGRTDVPLTLELEVLQNDDEFIGRTALEAMMHRRDISDQALRNLISSSYSSLRHAALRLCASREHPPVDVIKAGLLDPEYQIMQAAVETCQKVQLPLPTIHSWFKDADSTVRLGAVKNCIGRSDISTDFIIAALGDSDYWIREAAVQAAAGRALPSRPIIEQAWSLIVYNAGSDLYHQAMRYCAIVDDAPITLLMHGLEHADPEVRRSAIKAFRSQHHLSLLTLQELSHSSDELQRIAAVAACQTINPISLSIIQQSLDDPRRYVRVYTRQLVVERFGWLIRDYEPTGMVYAKCLGGVIVAAEIPADAHIVVANLVNHQLRASKAIIRDIIGDLFGESVGIAKFDSHTLYRVGDIVEFPDFNIDEREAQSGFYFYSTLEAAQNNEW